MREGKHNLTPVAGRTRHRLFLFDLNRPHGSSEPLPRRKDPGQRSKDEDRHDKDHRVVCRIDQYKSLHHDQRYALISSLVTVDPLGNNSSTTMKATHATATVPIGTAQRPRLKGPGENLLRPEVMRMKMGVA